MYPLSYYSRQWQQDLHPVRELLHNSGLADGHHVFVLLLQLRSTLTIHMQDNRWARAVYTLTAIIYIMLYFVFNIRLQFKVLTQRFRDLALNAPPNNMRRNIKCYLIGF